MNVVRGEGRSGKGDSKLEKALGAMGMRGCAWMLKWKGGTVYARVELGIQGIDSNPSESILLRRFPFQIFSKCFEMYDERYVSQKVKEGICGINFLASGNNRLSRRKVPKECLCREISTHDDHMETSNYERLRKARWRNVASSRKYVLRVIQDIY
ncbi:hypothetical protein PIB30_051546 [Stylosanthes scabra]|uniref:Uncharacterized protein n=1 Tax=Stylosanthes scabra TaxID=79078 RepID=A0ABU6WLB6_9FABA|nr:hypothetical protein [Stylosanthes scabra]